MTPMHEAELAAMVDEAHEEMRPRFKLLGRARWLNGDSNGPVWYVLRDQHGTVVRIGKRLMNAMVLGGEG